MSKISACPRGLGGSIARQNQLLFNNRRRAASCFPDVSIWQYASAAPCVTSTV